MSNERGGMAYGQKPPMVLSMVLSMQTVMASACRRGLVRVNHLGLLVSLIDWLSFEDAFIAV